jgi:hypothetical protein
LNLRKVPWDAFVEEASRNVSAIHRRTVLQGFPELQTPMVRLDIAYLFLYFLWSFVLNDLSILGGVKLEPLDGPRHLLEKSKFISATDA